MKKEHPSMGERSKLGYKRHYGCRPVKSATLTCILPVMELWTKHTFLF